MGSQTDLDQGGTFRQYTRVYQGPSVGYVDYPFQAVLEITTAGTYNLARGTTLVKVSVAGAVIINLPSSKATTQGPQAIPGQWVIAPVTIVDTGGHATANPITINPAAGETISGQATVSLAVDYGTVLLEPRLNTGGWNLGQ